MKKSILILILLSLVGTTLMAQTTDKSERKKNLVVKEWNTKVGTNKPVLDHQTIYDAQGRKIEEVEYASYGQKKRSTYEYKGDSKKVYREVEYNDKNKVTRVKIYEYDNEGHKSKQYNYRPDGKLESTKTFEYSYK